MTKPCQQHLLEGLDLIQLQYAHTYGYEKDELGYNTFTVSIATNNGCKKIDTIACCREHARDDYAHYSVVGVSR